MPQPRPSPQFARRQRAMLTNAEAILWSELRSRRFGGYKFRRQWPIGAYVADFVCLEVRLIVELDGAPHTGTAQATHDAARDAWLREQGFEVLRFPTIYC